MSDGSRANGDARSERERRLAEALRMNLKRRKAQQRERASTSEPPANVPQAPKGDIG